MNKGKYAALFILLSLGAQAAPVKAGKIGFVDVEKVLQGNAKGQSYVKLAQILDASLAKQAQQLQALQQKAVSAKATAADRSAFLKAQAAYHAAVKSAAAQRQKAFAPLSSSVNAAVSQAAKAQGFTVVFDKQVAAHGLVIYANDQTTDLTSAVQKAMK